MASEDDLIKRITRAIPSKTRGRGRFADRDGVQLGVGDDAAVISAGSRTDFVLSCDAFIEGIHFLTTMHLADSVGYKSLARASSDLAAMGAKPRLFLLTLAFPPKRAGTWLDQFLQGMGRATRLLGMELIGGDTTKCPLVSISITVLGEIKRGSAITRSGARPGDLIYVSGRLGQAHLGLELVRKGRTASYRSLLQPHLYPRIRVKLGTWLAENRMASAMMDLSDGLSTDLARLCTSSGVGARLFAGRIPSVRIPDAIATKLTGVKLDPLQMALHGGEDYELLFTIPQGKVERLRKAPGFSELTAIGEVTRDRQVLLLDKAGRAHTLHQGGWDPFRKKEEAG